MHLTRRIDGTTAATLRRIPGRWAVAVLAAAACFSYGLTASGEASRSGTFAGDVRPLLESHCLDCHDADAKKGGLDLTRFADDASVMADRATWAAVFEKVESGQMPPPKRKAQPAATERATLLAWIADVAARPDPQLGARDPGKPLLRRLTRLEYNNSVRDLLGIDTDVFTFSERLPFADKGYFDPTRAAMGSVVRVPLRQYGSRFPSLLPQAGLPGDNRAEHGYRNRGDAMNLSPLLLEKYFAVAGEIVHHPDLPRRSVTFAELLGLDPATLPPKPPSRKPSEPAAPAVPVPAVAALAPRGNVPATAPAGPATLNAFAAEVASAFREGRGGVYDVTPAADKRTVAGKGEVIKIRFGAGGGKTLEINPNTDLWLVSFGTATPSSGDLLIANKVKGEKWYELTFDVTDGADDDDEGVSKLGICVLGRKGQSGPVTLTAVMTDDTERVLNATLADGAAGNTFFGFAAHPGESIRRLRVDASGVKGEYVLIDDLAFVTNGKPVANAAPPPPYAAVPTAKPAAAARPAGATTRPLSKAAPRERLAAFVSRAFRRAASVQEVDRFYAVFTGARVEAKSEADAMRRAAQAVLASPGFLYLAEPVAPGAGTVRPLDGHELASRLSYFLWASAPDDQLLALAAEGKLADPAVLEVQARRMLRDPRARELSESFAAQWLRLDQLYTAKPDRGLFESFYSGPQGLSTLHGPMLVEALLLFETVMVEDRSVLEFVGADYTWLNPQLAKLYGVTLPPDAASGPAVAAADPVPGQPNRELKKDQAKEATTWRRVPLTDRTRGGFATMAGPLTITSLPFRTSPVKRGAWLLETVFNRPPTEPKVAFVLKDDTKAAAAATSVRQKFEAHRNNPNCYTCHVRLDPPGFALEVFDPIGQVRATDGPDRIDAAGEWNGRPFDGPAQFKAAVMADPREFVRGYGEHLMSYALGRKLEAYDMSAVDAVCRAAAADGHRFSRVIVEVVKSYPFRYVRNVDLENPNPLQASR